LLASVGQTLKTNCVYGDPPTRPDGFVTHTHTHTHTHTRTHTHTHIILEMSDPHNIPGHLRSSCLDQLSYHPQDGSISILTRQCQKQALHANMGHVCRGIAGMTCSTQDVDLSSSSEDGRVQYLKRVQPNMPKPQFNLQKLFRIRRRVVAVTAIPRN